MLTLFEKEPAIGHSMHSVCEPADATHKAPSSKVMNSEILKRYSPPDL